MPTPPKTSRDELIEIACSIVQARGADALTIAAVAAEAGIKGPSLYKHFADRNALLSAAATVVIHRFVATLRSETNGRSPKQRLQAMAASYRRFAARSPHLYQLMYKPELAADPGIAEASRLGVQPLFEELHAAGVPAKRMLIVGRIVVAYLHGFVGMEAGLAFRLGGDVDLAFEEGLRTILDL
jgi:AcrR family transcriptional regulator